MNSLISTILSPVASLRVTVTLLLLAMLLVFAGTTAQREMGVQDVQQQIFHSWLAKIQLHYFQPEPAAKAGHTSEEGYVHGFLYLPGGYSLIAMMLVNLLAAHALRFKLRWNRVGVIIIHVGIILLLVGELATSVMAEEGQMRVNEGSATNFAEDIRSTELAIVDDSAKDHDHVAVIAQSALASAAGKAAIVDPALPFEVKVEKWYENSEIRGPMQRGPGVDFLATSGSFKEIGLAKIPKFSGAGGEASDVNMPAAFVSFSKNGASLGTYLISLDLSQRGEGPQTVNVDGKSYKIDLRFVRRYKPYTVFLKKFTHEIVPGTDIPRDYASTIELTSPENHVDREVRIWMNHPLRFAGDTLYQSSFANNDKTSILQVVHNPVWTFPYFACALGTLGLMIQFGMKLVTFLGRRLAPTPGTVGALKKAAKVDSGSNTRPDHYTLNPEPAWKTVGIPAAAVLLGIIYVVSHLFSAPATLPYNYETLSHLPIFIDGRLQPLDSAARNLLGVVSGGRSSYEDADKKRHPAIEWLIDTMTRSHGWADDKVIRIDHPQIKDLFGFKEEEKLFSWNDLKLDSAAAREKIQKQASLAHDVPQKNRDSFQNGILDLYGHLGVLDRLLQVDAVLYQLEMLTEQDKLKAAYEGVQQALHKSNPKLMDDLQANRVADPERAFGQALAELDPALLTPEQRRVLETQLLLLRIRAAGPESQLLLIPPTAGSSVWRPIDGVLTSSADNDFLTASRDVLKLFKQYADGQADSFNGAVAGYQAQMASKPEMATVNFEVSFNRFNPFMNCIVLYVSIFMLAFVSWLGWTKPLWRAGFGLLVLALLVHTFGLAARIYISGRPPVTNLYSGAVFIGWAVVLFALVLEAIYKNGIGLCAGSAVGFLSLLVADGFAKGDGDTMRQLQAVLDTNLWLATHVVCVTLGYMASVLAGVLATVYIGRGLFDPSFDREDAQDTSRMIYAIACFAMLFSFVGTILGGIWADQSWGRFWGWDPKENGAVLVVLWNAIILHARWSGIVRQRGVAVMAVLGGIVVGWSFVGTNLLGIGLHSYGFMSGVASMLLLWCIVNLVIAALGLIPIRRLQ